MVKAILFDFWGTLVENGIWSPSKQLQNILKITLPFSEYILRMERAMMTSSFPSLREAFLAVAAEFQKEATEQQIEQLIGQWNTNWMLAKPYPETLQVLKELQKKNLLVLVSNADCFGIEKVMEKFSLSPYFSHQFLSYQKGLLKSDPQFWELVLQEIRVPAEECLMVGDSIESDMLPAQRAGLKTVLIDHKNKREFFPKILSLRELEGQV